jgi:hypothetical protein
MQIPDQTVHGSDRTLPEEHRLAFATLCRDIAGATPLLSWLAKAQFGAKMHQRQWVLEDRQWVLLERLASDGIIKQLGRRQTAQGTLISFRAADHSSRKFLNGEWLERYVWQVAKGARFEGSPLFDDCAYGVHFHQRGAEREVDFIGLRRGVGLIASCKTSHKCWDKAALDEIVSVGNFLGGRYCAKLFITNQPMPAPAHHTYSSVQNFLEHARTAKVAVVTGDELPRLEERLIAEALRPRI